MMTPDEEKKSGRDAYWRAREAADAGDSPEPDDDGLGVVSGADSQPDPEPDETTAADYPSEAMQNPLPDPKAAVSQYAATGKPAADPRADALSKLSTIASRKYTPSPQFSDEAIARAGAEHKQKVAHDDLSRAIQAWLFRKPFEPTPAEDESQSLLARRRMEQGDFERGKSQEMSATAALAKALATGKAPALTPYQIEQLKHRAVLDERTRVNRVEDKAQHEVERKENNEYRDRAHTDSEADRAASLKLSEAQFAALERERTDKDAQDLGKTLGDKASFDTKYNRLIQIAEAHGGNLPGLGVAEGIRQQPGIVGGVAQAISPSTPDAIESRKLLRQLAAGYAQSISGAGVSDRERQQLNAATVDVENGDSRIAMGGLKTLKEMYEAKAAVAKATHRPEAAKRIEGAMPVAPPSVPAGESVWVHNKKTNAWKQMSRAKAQAILQAPDAADFEVSDGKPQ